MTSLIKHKFFEANTTGHDDDFFATIENTSGKDMKIIFDEGKHDLPEIELKADEWCGLLSDEEGRAIWHALFEGECRIEFEEGEQEEKQ